MLALVENSAIEKIQIRSIERITRLLEDYRSQYEKQNAFLNPIAGSIHEEKIHRAYETQEKLVFILPGFPAKSPNPEKVLGVLPDFGEVLGLQSLNDLAKQIDQLYPYGVEFLICSDGRVFSDLVGVTEKNVSLYALEIRNILKNFNLNFLSTYDLDDVYENTTFDEKRQLLMAQYGESIENLQDHKNLFNGIHRFLFEDAWGMKLYPTRNKTREATKPKAWETIQRSQAWSKLLEDKFPNAVRLSIHPQPPTSGKLAVRLGNSQDRWATPWHNVVLKQGDAWFLTHRRDAEKKGAKVRYAHGIYPYFEI